MTCDPTSSANKGRVSILMDTDYLSKQ
jgi:hypothetical protein